MIWPKDFESWLLALTLWREARGTSDDAITGVACSIRNRTLKPAWWNSDTAGSYLSVILCPMQYSSFNRVDANSTKFPYSSDTVMPRIAQIAQAVMDGTQPDCVAGAQSYFDVSIAAPDWTRSMEFTVQIGPFRFYRV